MNKSETLKGIIISGRGIGSHRVTDLIHSFKDIHEKSIQLFPGTLNIILNKPLFLDNKKAYCQFNNSFFFWDIKLNGLLCYAYRWKKCPDHIIEIVSEYRLRDYFDLKEGSIVDIEIETQKTKKDFSRFLVWLFFWSFRTKWYYKYDTYELFVGKVLNAYYKIKKKKV